MKSANLEIEYQIKASLGNDEFEYRWLLLLNSKSHLNFKQGFQILHLLTE